MGMYRVLSLPHREDYDIVRRKTNTPVLARIEMGGRLFLTPTYLEQLQQGALIMAVADAKNLAVLASEYPRQARAKAEQELQAAEQEHGKLQAQVERLSGDRRLPFLDYVRQHIARPTNHDVLRFSAGPTAVARAAVEALRSEHGKQQVPSEWKSLIENYIKTGEISRENLEWLQGKMPLQFGVYNKLEKAQLEAERLRKGVEHYAALETGMERSLEALIRGGQNGEVAAIYDRAVDEAIQSGLAGEVLVPWTYVKARCPPDELEQQFLPTKRLGAIVTLLDTALVRLAEAYAMHNSELGGLISEMRKLYNVHCVRGMLVKPILPESPATESLYPDWRVKMEEEKTFASKAIGTAMVKDAVARIMGIVTEAGDSMGGTVAEDYGLRPDEIDIGWLRQTQGEIMQFLPLEVYWMLAVNAFYNLDVSRAATGKLGHDISVRRTLQRYRMAERRIFDDFGVTVKSVTEANGGTLDKMLEIFGTKAGFIGKVVKL